MASSTDEIAQIILIGEKRKRKFVRVWLVTIVLLALASFILPPHRFDPVSFIEVAGIVTLATAAGLILNSSTTNRLIKQANSNTPT